METEYSVNGRIVFEDKEAFLRHLRDRGFISQPNHGTETFKIPYKDYQFILKFGEKATLTLPNVYQSEKPGDACNDLSEKELEEFCREFSEKNSCKIFMCKGAETYGNANVFNGGSDYEIVNEEWFLCGFQNGAKILAERTNYWNPKIGELL